MSKVSNPYTLFFLVSCSTGRAYVILNLYTTILASTDPSTELQSLEADVSDGTLGTIEVQPSKYQHSYIRKFPFPGQLGNFLEPQGHFGHLT